MSKKKPEIDYFEIFSKALDEMRSSKVVTMKDQYFISMLHHMIQLAGKNDFNNAINGTVNYIGKKGTPEDVCAVFHKSLRQADVFSGKDNVFKGHLDMLFWNLLNATDFFQDILIKAINNK